MDLGQLTGELEYTESCVEEEAEKDKRGGNVAGPDQHSMTVLMLGIEEVRLPESGVKLGQVDGAGLPEQVPRANSAIPAGQGRLKKQTEAKTRES